MSLLWFAAGFVTCIVCQWLYAAWSLGDWALRFMRRGRLADLIGAGLVWALVIAAAGFAVWAASEALTMMAINIRGRY